MERHYSIADVGVRFYPDQDQLRNMYNDLGFVPSHCWEVAKDFVLPGDDEGTEQDYIWVQTRCTFYLVRVAETVPVEAYHVEGSFIQDISKVFSPYPTENDVLGMEFEKIMNLLHVAPPTWEQHCGPSEKGCPTTSSWHEIIAYAMEAAGVDVKPITAENLVKLFNKLFYKG